MLYNSKGCRSSPTQKKQTIADWSSHGNEHAPQTTRDDVFGKTSTSYTDVEATWTLSHQLYAGNQYIGTALGRGLRYKDFAQQVKGCPIRFRTFDESRILRHLFVWHTVVPSSLPHPFANTPPYTPHDQPAPLRAAGCMVLKLTKQHCNGQSEAAIARAQLSFPWGHGQRRQLAWSHRHRRSGLSAW